MLQLGDEGVGAQESLQVDDDDEGVSVRALCNYSSQESCCT